MLLPDTVTTGESVWDTVGRAEFEKNVAGLMRENDLPGTNQIYTLEDLPSGKCRSGSAILQLDVERELADDFAFIAACEEGANTVTAATIEVTSDFLRVVLAANEGVQTQVVSAMRSLLRKLETCAGRSVLLSDR